MDVGPGHGGRVARYGCGERDNQLVVFNDETADGLQRLYQQSCCADAHRGHWQQLLSQLNAQFIELLAAFLQLSLIGFVLDIVFINDAGSLLVGFSGQLLMLPDIVNLRGQGRKHADGTCAVKSHLLEERSEFSEAAFLVHRLEELHQGGVHVGLYKIGKLLDILPGYPGEGGRVSSHLRDDLTDGRGRHFVTLHVFVHGSTKAKDLRLGESGLHTDAGEACSKINQVARLCCRVLRQLVHGRAGGQHGTTEAARLILAEGHGQLADLIHGTLAEVITEGHTYLVGGIDKLQHGTRGSDAQPSRTTRQLVQLLARRAGVQLLEHLVHALHLFDALTGVLPHVVHLLVHLGEGFHAALHHVADAGIGTEYLRDGTPVGIQEIHATG